MFRTGVTTRTYSVLARLSANAYIVEVVGLRSEDLGLDKIASVAIGGFLPTKECGN